MAIKDWQIDERPREKLLLKGAESLSDSELLAIFLRTGTKEKSAIDLARELIEKFGSLAGIFSSPPDEVMSWHGVGVAKYVQIVASLEMAKRYLASQMQQTPILNSSQLVKDYLTTQLRHLRREVFAVIFLTNELKLIHFEILFTGGITSCSVCVKEVLRQTLKYGASRIIISHNHPNATATPSKSDMEITDTLAQACSLMDLSLDDHIIVGQDKTISLKEIGKL